MRRSFTSFIVLLLFTLRVDGQTVVEMYSGMNGFFLSESGQPIPFWGYGYIEDGFMTLPAPTLRFDVDEAVEIHMVNWSTEAHTIHLHGLDVDQMNDGVPHTSEYIFPNDTGVYAFSSSWPGTYFYHCHVTTTLHLTMGMYGMVIIEYPDNQIFGGPVFDKDYAFMATDLEYDTNWDPFGSYPFHEIRPNYFMLNGKQGTQLTENEAQYIWYEDGDQVLLRLNNLAYTLVEYELPPELNATVYTTDGRPLPEPFETNLLEVYPGERFSVIISPPNGYEGSIFAHYYSMINKTFEHTNEVPIRNGIYTSIAQLDTPPSFEVFPNPAGQAARIKFGHADVSDLTLCSLQGAVVQFWPEVRSGEVLNFEALADGVYILTDLMSGATARIIIRK